MGTMRLFSKGADVKPEPMASTSPNPNPFRFIIMRAEDVGILVVALINYPDATTFDGDKVLVFKGNRAALWQRKSIDPHFVGAKDDPIARFPGNDVGWQHAIRFAKAYHL